MKNAKSVSASNAIPMYIIFTNYSTLVLARIPAYTHSTVLALAILAIATEVYWSNYNTNTIVLYI